MGLLKTLASAVVAATPTGTAIATGKLVSNAARAITSNDNKSAKKAEHKSAKK